MGSRLSPLANLFYQPEISRPSLRWMVRFSGKFLLLRGVFLSISLWLKFQHSFRMSPLLSTYSSQGKPGLLELVMNVSYSRNKWCLQEGVNMSVDRHVGLSRTAFLKLPISCVLLAVEVGLVLADSFLAMCKKCQCLLPLFGLFFFNSPESIISLLSWTPCQLLTAHNQSYLLRKVLLPSWE